MATLTIKNIPDDLYEAFKQVARKNHRSINGEVIFWLERAVQQREPDPETILSNAQLVRETLGIYTTNDEINAAIDEGRP